LLPYYLCEQSLILLLIRFDMDSFWISPYYPMRSFFDFRPLHLLSALEESTRDMDRQFNQLEGRLNSALRQELQSGGSNNASLSLGVQPEIVTEGDAKKYRMNIHMGQNFAPEDLKEVKSSLTPEGILKIEAPLPQQALPEPPKSTNIPVSLE
ncbi:unnamed protein product, partial [Allacma fusca]